MNPSESTTIEGKVMTTEEWNAAARKWAKSVRYAALQNVAGFTKGRGEPYTIDGKIIKPLKDDLNIKTYQNYGDISGFGFKFPLHGIFRAYGVGRGGTANRTPSNWLNEPLDQNEEKLADIAAEYYGDQVLVNIKGVKIGDAHEMKQYSKIRNLD